MLTIEASPGYEFRAGEKVDNDKLNLLGLPTNAVTGGLENTQARADGWFYLAATGAANAYVGQLATEDQDPAAYEDGLVVAVKIPAAATNTGASQFQLKLSDGTAFAAVTIKKRGRDVVAGDLVAGQIYELRYESTGPSWILMSPALVEQADIIPGAGAFGTDNASTATAYVMKFDPAPAALVAGLTVRFIVPVTNGAAVTLQVQTAAAVNVGSAVAIHRVSGVGRLAALNPGELVGGVEVATLVYNGTFWILESPVPADVSAGLGTAVSLVVGNNASVPNTKVDVTATQLQVNATGGGSSGGTRLLSSVSVTADITVSGSNGLDTGAAANATWYFIYVLWNAQTNGQGVLLSASSTSPTIPAGYTHSVRVGAVYRDGGGAFVPFQQRGRKVWVTPQQVFSGKAASAGNTYQVLSGADLILFQAAVPSIATVARGVMGTSATATGWNMAVAASAAGLAVTYGAAETTENSLYDGMAAVSVWEVPVVSPVNLYWKDPFGTAAAHVLKVTGFDL